MIAPSLRDPLMAIQITNHGLDSIFAAQLGVFPCHLLWIKWTGTATYDIDDVLRVLFPRFNLVYQPYAREGADGLAVVCPLLRGSSPTRWVAPKQHRVSGVLSLRHFSGWFSLSLGAWVPKNLARRSMVSAGSRIGKPRGVMPERLFLFRSFGRTAC